MVNIVGAPHVDDRNLPALHHEPLVRGEAGLLRQLGQRLPHNKHVRTLLPERGISIIIMNFLS